MWYALMYKLCVVHIKLNTTVNILHLYNAYNYAMCYRSVLKMNCTAEIMKMLRPISYIAHM
jgi:hypothetical protein